MSDDEKAKTVQGDVAPGVLAGMDQVKGAKRPPVHLWHPPYCGEIDMRIAADGVWYYLGGPITRQAMVKLFASILRRDPERYVLVTPVEMVGITVEDAPFIATSMLVEGDGENQNLTFTTNVGDDATVSLDHPMRFERQPNGGYKPYVMVRDNLWAMLTRTLYGDVVALCVSRDETGAESFGVWSGGSFFKMANASELSEDAST